MGSSDRADIGALVELAQRVQAVRRTAMRFAQLQDAQDNLPLVQRLLDELIEPGAARLRAALGEPSGNV